MHASRPAADIHLQADVVVEDSVVDGEDVGAAGVRGVLHPLRPPQAFHHPAALEVCQKSVAAGDEESVGRGSGRSKPLYANSQHYQSLPCST
jgi:hypothetical protein